MPEEIEGTRKAIEDTREYVKDEVNSSLEKMGVDVDNWNLDLRTPLENYEKITHSISKKELNRVESEEERKRIKEARDTFMEWMGRRGKEKIKKQMQEAETKAGEFPKQEIVGDWDDFAGKKGLENYQIGLGHRFLGEGSYPRFFSTGKHQVEMYVPFKGRKDPKKALSSEIGHTIYTLARQEHGLPINHEVSEIFDHWFSFKKGNSFTEAEKKGFTATSPVHVSAGALFTKILSESSSLEQAERTVHSLAGKVFENHKQIDDFIDRRLDMEGQEQTEEEWPPNEIEEWREILSTLHDAFRERERAEDLRCDLSLHGTRGAFSRHLLEKAKETDDKKERKGMAEKALEHSKKMKMSQEFAEKLKQRAEEILED